MNPQLLLVVGFCSMLIMSVAAMWMMREARREKRVAARVRMIHGQPPEVRRSAEPKAALAAMLRGMAALGQAILRSGVVSARTLSELEGTLESSGLRGSQGVGVFIGSKILGLTSMPTVTWLILQNINLGGTWSLLLPVVAGVMGLLSPDYLIGMKRKRYLAKLEQGLPDALDLMVICAQAGLGLGPAVIRVAEELRHAYRETATEFEKTANELQVMADSRIAVLNLGQRTGLDTLKRLSSTLVQTLQYGTPLVDALRILSAEMRQEMMHRREARAARLPVLLTLPTMIFILPCVFLIAGGPAIIQIMHNFPH